MSKVQQVIAQLLIDHAFRARVQINGVAALKEYNLTEEELAIVIHLNLEQWNSGTGRMIFDGPDSGTGRGRG